MSFYSWFIRVRIRTKPTHYIWFCLLFCNSVLHPPTPTKLLFFSFHWVVEENEYLSYQIAYILDLDGYYLNFSFFPQMSCKLIIRPRCLISLTRSILGLVVTTKYHRQGSLNNRHLLFSQFWKLGSPRNCWKEVSSWDCFSWFIGGHHPSVCAHDLFFVDTKGER